MQIGEAMKLDWWSLIKLKRYCRKGDRNSRPMQKNFPINTYPRNLSNLGFSSFGRVSRLHISLAFHANCWCILWSASLPPATFPLLSFCVSSFPIVHAKLGVHNFSIVIFGVLSCLAHFLYPVDSISRRLQFAWLIKNQGHWSQYCLGEFWKWMFLPQLTRLLWVTPHIEWIIHHFHECLPGSMSCSPVFSKVMGSSLELQYWKD